MMPVAAPASASAPSIALTPPQLPLQSSPRPSPSEPSGLQHRTSGATPPLSPAPTHTTAAAAAGLAMPTHLPPMHLPPALVGADGAKFAIPSPSTVPSIRPTHIPVSAAPSSAPITIARVSTMSPASASSVVSATDTKAPASIAGASSAIVTQAADDATVAAEWERPLNDNHEDLLLLLSSPARPSTPLHATPPPYPIRNPTPDVYASPGPGPCACAGNIGTSHPFAMLRIPPPSPHRGPSPRGEQRAMVEWAAASARHLSPHWRAPSPRWGAQSPRWGAQSPRWRVQSPHTAVAGTAVCSVSPHHSVIGTAPSTTSWSFPQQSPSTTLGGTVSVMPPLHVLHVTDAAADSAQRDTILMPPPLPPQRSLSASSAELGAEAGGGLGACTLRSQRLEQRPSTDPRSSPAWRGPVGSGWPPMSLSSRPNTDPRTSPQAALLSSLAAPLPSGPSALLSQSPRESPRRLSVGYGAMLPPPPRLMLSLIHI